MVALMPARNVYHEAVVAALVTDGWTVTDDPLCLSIGGRDLFIDLGAERNTIAAERGGERIAVEVQTFAGASDVRNLQEAIGQYEIYRALLAVEMPDAGCTWQYTMRCTMVFCPSRSASS